ncbi:hypothetical protein HNP46_005800 [Pseudomonas nitritireducens]|uniref:Uncharacterized protein n=1 Tax=Pseudomonas nitroreducens TaxID=46680 RepID=A0A7W7KR00_PSENT|nr:hypothetical protein [Pseudomonas nitritireducens]MBB4866893.1 hypothetical protein [Pseudomonas nitritireducens]
MRPYSPNTNKGRTVAGDDIRDGTKSWSESSAKAMRHAARQEAELEIRAVFGDPGPCPCCVDQYPEAA